LEKPSWDAPIPVFFTIPTFLAFAEATVDFIGLDFSEPGHLGISRILGAKRNVGNEFVSRSQTMRCEWCIALKASFVDLRFNIDPQQIYLLTLPVHREQDGNLITG
jgi:hypothetical protein